MTYKTNFVIQGTDIKTGAVGYWTKQGLQQEVRRGNGLYDTYVGAHRVRLKLSKYITDTHWEVLRWSSTTETTRPVTPDDKMKSLEFLYQRKVKAFIRYSSVDRKQVVYFRRGCRMFKMLDANNFKMMATRVTFNHWLGNISRDVKTIPVFEDEQVMYNGKPLDIPMDIERVHERWIEQLTYRYT